MSTFPVWFRYVAFAGACLIAGGAAWPIPVLRELLIIGSLFAIGGAVVHGWKGRRDPYDLNALREFDEREELRNLDVPDGKEIDQVQCLCCMEVYSAHYKVCPRCKASAGNRGCC